MKKYSSHVQAIAFYKSVWSKSKALKWLKNHDYIPIKDVHETKGMLHYRLIEPKNFKRYVSQKVDDKGILLTIGLKKDKNEQNGVKGGELPLNDLKAENLVERGFEANPLQEVFPLSKESSILDHPVIGVEGYNRGLNKDAVSIDDVAEKKVLNMTQKGQGTAPIFGPGDMIYEMMKPTSQGGIGFPFPTSSSSYSPMDWFRLWSASK